MTNQLLPAVRAEALFASSISTNSTPTRTQVEDAIRTAVRACGGTRGCASVVAQAYGDYPDSAVQRMRWATTTVQNVLTHKPCTHHTLRMSITTTPPPVDPELLAQHDWDELVFGGFLCLTCTPDAAYDEDPDLTVAWPCPTLRAAGMTNEHATAVIIAHREAIEAEARAERERAQLVEATSRPRPAAQAPVTD